RAADRAAGDQGVQHPSRPALDESRAGGRHPRAHRDARGRRRRARQGGRHVAGGVAGLRRAGRGAAGRIVAAAARHTRLRRGPRRRRHAARARRSASAGL
ncbi:MAG: (AJ250023) putative polyketide synthase, partial [uncultured Gemmatimonadetes bacterium]